MSIDTVISSIDAEIERLTKARKLLLDGGEGSRNDKLRVEATSKKRAKRVMSPEARKRIADAQRKRWAKQKKAAK